jgi:hypothetical protein
VQVGGGSVSVSGGGECEGGVVLLWLELLVFSDC